MSPFRLALTLAVLTFGLLLVGGTVNPTGSSLACPDWPLCYGQVFPEMKGGVLFEHGHRMAATLVGFVTCLFVVATWRVRPVDRGLRRLSVTMLGAVILQGVLGGVTVIFKLPTLVSTGHLALSMVFFLLVLHACFRSSAAWRPVEASRVAGGGPRSEGRAARAFVVLAGAAVYLQVVMGGLVRHTGAGRACGVDFPTCGGELWPQWASAQLHQIHRLVGVLLVVLVAAAAAVAARHAAASGRRLARVAALLAPALTVVQVALGILTVTTGIDVATVTAHLGVAALILASLFVTYRGLGPEVAAADAPRRADVPRSFGAEAAT